MDAPRRQFLRFLAASSLLAGLPACSRPPGLRIAGHVWPGYEFMFLARDEGWLDERLVNLFETSSASASLQLLSTGQVDAAALTLDEMLLAREQGIPLVAVLVCNISVGADKVISRTARKLQDLRGQRIGVETTALGQLILNKTLAAAGLNADEVKVIPVDATDSGPWHAGELDAMITFEPLAGRLLREGGIELYSSRYFPDSIFDLLTVRADRLKQQDAAIRHLVAGHFRALSAFQTNPVDTAYRLARRLEVTGQQVPELYRGLQLPDVAANRIYLTPPSTRLAEATRTLADLMIKNGQLHLMPDPEVLFTAAYLPPGER
ncbi:ABC transporter substrate-binding protein [Marinospirillum alkaliphilum]|uniref:NitT/TauT family transport system substrate-binding protein n=1 Tax=Marinospirillum alkaliphilum DSM 21637 TaxID=1122209 RepID=A0A1K1YUR8_9GAMM|nr:ABC transporter substrate-binding protein [Marinospirillum alkaliphilum]SFX65697.1 NitT/TauT family transport system substrate-binding protein [Marinospirillum alkaliphilum DSM 21637]